MERDEVALWAADGVGVAVLAASRAVPLPWPLNVKDIDLVVPYRAARRTFRALTGSGWSGDPRSVLFNDASRMAFCRGASLPLEVFSAPLRFSHDVPLKSLDLQSPLYLDIEDKIGVLHLLAAAQRSGVPGWEWLAHCAGRSWGLETTIVENLNELEDFLLQVVPSALYLKHELARLRMRVLGSGKSLCWTARALIGRRIRWYYDIEEQ